MPLLLGGRPSPVPALLFPLTHHQNMRLFASANKKRDCHGLRSKGPWVGLRLTHGASRSPTRSAFANYRTVRKPGALPRFTVFLGSTDQLLPAPRCSPVQLSASRTRVPNTAHGPPGLRTGGGVGLIQIEESVCLRIFSRYTPANLGDASPHAEKRVDLVILVASLRGVSWYQQLKTASNTQQKILPALLYPARQSTALHSCSAVLSVRLKSRVAQTQVAQTARVMRGSRGSIRGKTESMRSILCDASSDVASLFRS